MSRLTIQDETIRHLRLRLQQQRDIAVRGGEGADKARRESESLLRCLVWVERMPEPKAEEQAAGEGAGE